MMTDYSFTKSVRASSSEAMMALGAKLSRILRMGDVVLLYGDLGAGKTTFSRGLIQEIMLDHEEVVSPTFTLVQTYPTADFMLYHYDLYRLDTGNAMTLTELGWDESIQDGVTLVEWPERLENAFIPRSALFIRITPCPDQSRVLQWSGHESWQKRLDFLDIWPEQADSPA